MDSSKNKSYKQKNRQNNDSSSEEESKSSSESNSYEGNDSVDSEGNTLHQYNLFRPTHYIVCFFHLLFKILGVFW